MAAVDASIYENITLQSNDQSQDVDLRLGVSVIEYWESILSPTITAKIEVINTGDSIAGKDGKLQSIYNGLPLRGGERLALKIAPNSETNKGLDFSIDPHDYLHVDRIENVISNQQTESFDLHLVSREAITNETTRVPEKFPTSSTIDASVEKILDEYLKTEKDKFIDETSNKYGFIGNLRKPFNLITWLASKAVPKESEDATAGFLFYQTQDGYHFRSVDDLIKQEPKAEYLYTEVNKSSIDRNNDFNILRYSTVVNQNLLEKLRLGVYSSFVATYDPASSEFSLPQQGEYKLEQYAGKAKNLGKVLDLPPIEQGSDETLGDIPSRLMTAVLDRGIIEKESVLTETNADPMKYQFQSVMRYNVLGTQQLNMTIPLNTNLRPGDIIKCNFPRISRGGQEIDDEQSGLYMIKDLCHRFDSDSSQTGMVLVRDTFGLYGTNNK